MDFINFLPQKQSIRLQLPIAFITFISRIGTCESPMMKSERKTDISKPMIHVCCAIIVQDQKVFVVQRSDTMEHPGLWEFPGGKIRDGERGETAIRREIREELAVEISVHQELASIVHDYYSFRIKLYPFLCSIQEGIIHLIEHRQYRWCTQRELIALPMTDADLKLLNKVFQFLS